VYASHGCSRHRPGVNSFGLLVIKGGQSGSERHQDECGKHIRIAANGCSGLNKNVESAKEIGQMNREFERSDKRDISGGTNNFRAFNSGMLSTSDFQSSPAKAKPSRSVLERVLLPMLVAATAFLGVLLGLATYEFGTNTNAVPFAIGNWVTAIAACILIILGVLAIFSDSSAS
jgi:hypothetical protein